MLTRLEVHGFKNLINFSIDFGPFTCIAGLNGVGKSNIFDAIRFLSLLSDLTIIEAALAVRDSESSNPEDIFWTNGKTRTEKISLAAEMLVDQDVIDDFGRKATASSTFLRYEVEIKREASPNSMNGTTHLQLENESLNYFTKGEAKSQILFPHKASTFRDSVVKNKRRSGNFISTTRAKEDGVVEINLHQDSNSRGQPQKFPANYSPKTAIANTNSSVWPTILAARREMQAWRFLALEPSSMRRSNKFHETSSISSSGNHLASTLKKLSEQDSLALSSISNKLSSIIPISGLRVDTDEVRQLLTLEAKERAGAFLPARALSDGTLRFLTLCIMSEDPEFKGLLCFEEPENGIHPAKIESILTLLKEMSVNPQEPVSLDNPLRQIIIATHSPVLVQLQEVDDLVYIETVKVKGPDGSPTATLRCKSLEGSWRIYKDNQRTSKASIVAYLSYPRNAQITMEV